jgi:uncharacterized protein
MNPVDIINEYCNQSSMAYKILIHHGKQVAQKAIDTAKNLPHLNPDLEFIKNAAMLHDIGIIFTNTPSFGCRGEHSYICHGYLGRNLLEKRGLLKLALVCERHVGTGITAEDIRHYNLPLPERNMEPRSIEEKIICYADKFFSKSGNLTSKEKAVGEIKENLSQYGQDKVAKFQSWIDFFEGKS